MLVCVRACACACACVCVCVCVCMRACVHALARLCVFRSVRFCWSKPVWNVLFYFCCYYYIYGPFNWSGGKHSSHCPGYSNETTCFFLSLFWFEINKGVVTKISTSTSFQCVTEPPPRLVSKRKEKSCCSGHTLVCFGTAQFSWSRYLCARKSPHTLHPVSQKFPQRCLWNGSNVRLIDDGPLSSFQGRRLALSLSTPLFSTRSVVWCPWLCAGR